jgi:hypothetical protein
MANLDEDTHKNILLFKQSYVKSIVIGRKLKHRKQQTKHRFYAEIYIEIICHHLIKNKQKTFVFIKPFKVILHKNDVWFVVFYVLIKMKINHIVLCANIIV